MSQGQILEVWLDSGEPIEQVPHSLAIAGYDDQTLEEVDNFFKLSIRLGLEH
jgi:TusA-related sulfurtransferase